MAIDILKQSVALVRGRGRGTGFFIGNDGSLLTCFHVVGNNETGKLTDKELVVTYSGVEYPAKCIRTPSDPRILDVAVLRLVDGKLPPGATLLPLGKWKSDSGQTSPARTFGFRPPEMVQGLFAKGEISGLIATESGAQLLQFSSQAVGAEEIRQGMSGAPVYLDATGQIVGVIALRIKQVGETIPCAIPTQVIADIWPPVATRLREEELLQQLYKEVLRPGVWFTETTFKSFYKSLPIPAPKKRYDQLGEDKYKALLDQIRDQGQVYHFINCIRVKRPDIPLAKLLELPSVHRIQFVDRDDERKKACERYAPSYILFEAPAGYGKTDLLREVERQHFGEGWLSIYVETPQDIVRAAELANQVAAQTGYPRDISYLRNTQAIGYILAGFLQDQLISLDAPGIVLLIDNVERLPEGEISDFLNHFLGAIWSVFKKVRVRFAGRYVGSLWKKQAEEFELTVIPLLPFGFRSVRETVRSLFPEQKELDLRSAYLMHMTGGHPGCMVEIMERMDFAQLVEKDLKARQDEYKEIVLSVAREIRKSIPEPLQNTFDVLSVFRRYNYRQLQQIIDEKLIEYGGDAYSLENDLVATYLVERKPEPGFLQGEIVRRLLAIRLRWEEPERFLELCQKAKQIYKQDLQQLAIYRPDIIAIEVLYQELELGYYGGEQTLVARKALRDRFFADGGILRRYLKILATKSDAPAIIAGLRASLEGEHGSWEFRFAVNFFLRGDQYSNEPYEEMLVQVGKFLDQVTSERR